MLCGQRPSGAFDPPSHRVQVDVRLDQVVIKAMQQQPERRYQQVSEMKTDVDRIRTTPQQRKPAPKRKSKSPVTVAVITVCLALASAGGFVIWKKAHQPGEADQASVAQGSPALQRVEPSSSSGRPDGLKPPTTLPAALDLIALVDVQRDRLRAEGNAGVNQWTKSAGQLAFVSGDKRAGKMGAPVALNGLRDYEVEVGVPNTPESAIGLDFPISATNQATIAFVPGKEVMVRDENGRLKAMGAWPKEAAGPPWKLAGRVKLDSDGMNGTLSAAVNGLRVGEWSGALGKLGRSTEAHPEFPGQLVPALYVPAGDCTLSSWTLRVFDGEAKVLRGPGTTVSPSPSPQVSQSPASATKGAPFVNTLGMKFVPVPIAGGPTGGQRVLFSVWETRVQDYEVFAKETRHKAPKPEFPQGPTHPVVGMSWDDAQAFCKWLTERERKSGKLAANESYRLPSDHEWSCAVGIGDREDAAQLPEEKNQKITDVFPWGTVWPPPAGAGNFSGEEVSGQETWPDQKVLRGHRDDFPATAPVGSFAAERLGLFDLGGNVREWCEDWFDAKQEGRVMRGASFDIAAGAFLRSSYRSSVPAISRFHRSGGFRVVLALVAP